MQFGIPLVGSNQQDLGYALDLAIDRKLDPPVMALGVRRQDLDDQERVFDRLPAGLVGGASCRDIGFEVGVGAVGSDDARLDLCIAGTPSRQRGIDP